MAFWLRKLFGLVSRRPWTPKQKAEPNAAKTRKVKADPSKPTAKGKAKAKAAPKATPKATTTPKKRPSPKSDPKSGKVPRKG